MVNSFGFPTPSELTKIQPDGRSPYRAVLLGSLMLNRSCVILYLPVMARQAFSDSTLAMNSVLYITEVRQRH